MSGAATICPSCNKPLPAAVVSGPAQAVVRCEGCQTLLLWSNGRVMRSAKSSTGTMMGMPAVKVPATPGGRESEAPLPELKPEADAVPVTAKSSFPKPPPAKTPPPRGATQPLSKVPQKAPGVTGLGDNVPTKVVAPSPELRKESARKDPTPAPMKVPPSGPVKLPPAAPAAPAAAKPTAPAAKPAAPAAKPAAPAAKTAAPATKTTQPMSPVAAPTEPETPHVLAAVAQVPQMPSSGEMVDPSAWFAGDVSDVVPPEKLPAIEASRPERPAEPTGAAPLPPPPTFGILEAEPLEIEPFGEEKTPAVGLSAVDMSGPIPIAKSDEPSLQIAVAPPRPARESSQKVSTLPPAPSAPVPREPSQKIATLPPAPAAAPGAKKSASSIRGADPLVPAAVGAGPSTDLPSARTHIGKAPEAPASSRATIMGRPAMELPKAAEPKPAEPKSAEPKALDPIAAAVTMLPPSPSPAPKSEPRMEPLRPERADPTPARAHVAVNVPEPVSMKEPSAEALPPPPVTPVPPPMMALEATSQTTLPVTSRVPRAIPRRMLFIVGGAAVGVIALVFMVLALSHGGTPATKAKPAPAPAPVAATKPEPSAPAAPTTAAPTTAAPTTAAPTTAKPEPATPEPSAPPAAPVATPEPSGAAAAPATPSPPRPRHTLGGKKVVLEYDPKPTSPAPPPATAPTPMGEDPATVARAREAYHKGNVKLFAGDTAGAIALYRESLKIYPGYVAGYRGLGLGYEAAGNKDEALKAFHTYVRTVPSAADTTIIRRRIEHLESAPAKR